MLRALVEVRRIVALGITGVGGAWAVTTYPFSTGDPFLGLSLTADG